MAVWGNMNLSCITLSDTLLSRDISHWGINAPENNPPKRESGLKVKGRLHLKYLISRNTWGSKWKITSSFFFFSSLLLSVFLCNSPDRSRGPRVWVVRFINDKTHLHGKSIYQIPLWWDITGKGGWGGAHLVYVSAPVSVSTLKCRQCDTLITGDINELKLKLRNGGGVKKWVLTEKKLESMVKGSKGKRLEEKNKLKLWHNA